MLLPVMWCGVEAGFPLGAAAASPSEHRTRSPTAPALPADGCHAALVEAARCAV